MSHFDTYEGSIYADVHGEAHPQARHRRSDVSGTEVGGGMYDCTRFGTAAGVRLYTCTTTRLSAKRLRWRHVSPSIGTFAWMYSVASFSGSRP